MPTKANMNPKTMMNMSKHMVCQDMVCRLNRELFRNELKGLYLVLPEIKMKHTGPDKREKTSCKVSDESHEKREVRNKDSKENGDEDTANSESQTPDLEFSILRPD